MPCEPASSFEIAATRCIPDVCGVLELNWWGFTTRTLIFSAGVVVWVGCSASFVLIDASFSSEQYCCFMYPRALEYMLPHFKCEQGELEFIRLRFSEEVGTGNMDQGNASVSTRREPLFPKVYPCCTLSPPPT